MSNREMPSLFSAISTGRPLGDFQKCSICGEYGWTNIHRCPPIYYVRLEGEYPDDATMIRAENPEQAACLYYERCLYNGDLTRSTSNNFLVRDLHDQNEWKIEASYEMVPSFSSHVIETKAIDPEEEPDKE